MNAKIGFALLNLAALLHTSVSDVIVKRGTDDSPLCTYTFDVFANPGESCPSSTPSDGRLAEIQASLDDFNSWRNDLNSWRNDLNSRLTGGVTYKRWGRKDCPRTSRLVYEGST